MRYSKTIYTNINMLNITLIELDNMIDSLELRLSKLTDDQDITETIILLNKLENERQQCCSTD